jgi:hypothetical protein
VLLNHTSEAVTRGGMIIVHWLDRQHEIHPGIGAERISGPSLKPGYCASLLKIKQTI